MDFLALTALTVINDCLKHALSERLMLEFDWHRLALNDEKSDGGCLGKGALKRYFNLNLRGCEEICRKLKPKELKDLAALTRSTGPGPARRRYGGRFIQRHRGQEKRALLLPEMKEILGIPLACWFIRNRIMQLAQKLAGYTLSDADLMRRAMGKKKREEMANTRRSSV